MPVLIPPDARVHRSFVAAMAEFQAEGHGEPHDDSVTGYAIRAYANRWLTPPNSRFTSGNSMTRPGKTHRVPKGVCRRPRCGGSVAINTWAGYRSATGSRPTFGRSAAISATTSGPRPGSAGTPPPACRRSPRRLVALGIARALLTSDEDNLVSRKVIEANGGVLEDKSGGKVRYWVPTSW